MLTGPYSLREMFRVEKELRDHLNRNPAYKPNRSQVIKNKQKIKRRNSK